MKFKHKIVLVSSAVLFLALSVLSIKQYFSIKHNLETQVDQSVSEIIQGMSNTVTAQMDGSINLATLTTGLVANIDSLPNAAPLLSQPKLTEQFILIGYGEEQTGKYVASNPSWDPGPTWDPRKRPWYTDAKDAGQIIVTAPYADSVSNEIVVSIGTPVKKNGNFHGAIFFDVSLAKLGNMINSFNLFDAGFAFMVSKDGIIISHPNTKLNGQNASQFLGSLAFNTTKTQSLTLNDKEHIIVFKEVEGYDWLVGVALEKKTVFSAIDALTQDSVVFTVLFVLVSIVVLSIVINFLMKPLADINDAMANIAQGNADLTVRLNTASEPEFSSLAQNFNLFTTRLQQLIADIQVLGHEILADAKQTSSGANHASTAISRQLESLSALALATENMSTTEQRVATTAQEAAEAIQSTDSAALDGQKIVTETTDTIAHLSEQITTAVNVVNELEVSSSGIEQILSVINGIAEQTNLLALNAAIEAARAGESGRGFAVVADEVRTLAQRTQEATTEIKTMIDQLQSGAINAVQVMKQSQSVVEKTVGKADETKSSLDTIRSAIAHIVDLNLHIASMLNEQRQVVDDVNHNALEIRNISDMVFNEANTVDETMQSQVDKIAHQENMLEQFKV
ncbi:chemotaxis protein [Pseudoalteromonas citrea]|uniref:Chemotaxis protein n=1 Tax=Pseudoalteromonas citrea TaxID=43655 RepID=A0A5S3XWY9_9GAMM|nr:methyl-accepting chemotaxis protein [Pseudoalteromonas citrea]TMP42200.1 chemotaxis protein [Pseudoalteromonas citrea]TMP62330.1 chemotaxis protein [Pseudoalteromonas citrea]